MNRPIKPPKPLPNSTVMRKEIHENDDPVIDETLPRPKEGDNAPNSINSTLPPSTTYRQTETIENDKDTPIFGVKINEKRSIETNIPVKENSVIQSSPVSTKIETTTMNSNRKSTFLTPEHWATSNRRNKYQLSPTTELDSTLPSPLPSKSQPPTEEEKMAERLRMYHHIHFSDEWLVLTILFHITLFTFLLSIGYEALNPASLAVLLIASTIVVVLLLLSRYNVGKLPRSLDWSQNVIRTPDQETDLITNDTIYFLGLASIVEGFALALYPVVTARYSRQNHVIGQHGFLSYTTLVQILAFGSIVIFGFHKILRPANRLDPLRTIFEVFLMILSHTFIPFFNS